MPWTAKDAPSHNHAATGAKAEKWAKVANAVLERTGDDGQAIRVANAQLGPHMPRYARKAKG